MLERIDRLSIFFAFVVSIIYVRADCDFCQRESFVACHSERVFSLCIQGNATRDYITCPDGYVCSQDAFTCYPKERVTPSCARSYIVTDNRINQCGICNEPNRNFACLNETTVAFCFGQKNPDLESTDVCPDGMICDLKNNKQFCSDATRVEPSCITKHVPSAPVTTSTTTAEEPTTSTTTTSTMTELSSTITTTEMPKTTTKSAEELTTTTTTTKMPITTTTIMEQPSSTSTTPTTEKPTTMSTTTTTTTEKPITTTEGTTTSRAPRSPNTLCREMGESGNFRPDGDLGSCSKFINCYVLNGSLRGTERECQNEDDFFDPVIRKCGTNKPEDCI